MNCPKCNSGNTICDEHSLSLITGELIDEYYCEDCYTCWTIIAEVDIENLTITVLN